VEGKGYEEFLQAASLVLRRIPEARFLIAGNGPGGDSRYETSMRKLADDLGLNGSLLWAGWRRDIFSVLRSLNVVAQVSTSYEGFGRVAVEALACGTPVVATSLPAFSEVLGNGEAGLLVLPGDAQALAQGIITLLEDRSLAEHLATQGRNRAQRLFSREAHVEKIEHLYREILHLSGDRVHVLNGVEGPSRSLDEAADDARGVRLLMLGSGDTALLEPRTSANAWSQDRHATYSNLLDRLCIVIKTTGKRWDVQSLSQRATVYPTNSSNPLTGMWDMVRVALQVAREERINLIVTADIFTCAWVGYLLKLRLKVPLALQMLGDFVDNPNWLKESWRAPLVNQVAKWLLKRADTIRVHGNAVREKLIERYGIDPSRIVVIPIPIQRKPYLAIPEPSHAGSKTVLWIGRMVPQKDIPTLLNTARRVCERHPEARFRLVGYGPEEPTARRLVKEFGITGQTEFVGRVAYDRLADEYARCDIFLLCSRYEDAPRVPVEAALSARPVVATSFSGAEEAVVSGQTGFIVPVGDDQALADRICRLLEEPPLRIQMGREGRRHAQGIWLTEDVLRQYAQWWGASACNGR